MKTINTLRYTGSNHVTLIADKKNNPTLISNLQATALSPEEAEEQLKADLSLQIEGEFEIAITDFDIKRFKALGTEKLLALYEKTEQMLGAREMIEGILIKRGAIVINEPEEGEDIEETEETEEETKPKREYKKCMTEECLQARLIESRKNYKKFAKFLCTKDKEEHFGIIRSARLDKRSGFIQYRIEIISQNEEGLYAPTGLVYGKGDDSKDLTIFDEKPEEIEMVPPTPKEKPAPKEKKSKKNTKAEEPAEPAQETETVEEVEETETVEEVEETETNNEVEE